MAEPISVIDYGRIPIANVVGLETALQSTGAPGNIDGGNAGSTFDTVFDGGGANG